MGPIQTTNNSTNYNIMNFNFYNKPPSSDTLSRQTTDKKSEQLGTPSGGSRYKNSTLDIEEF